MFGPERINDALPEGQEWKSDIHRKVTSLALCWNPGVKTLEQFQEYAAIINSYSDSEIRLVSAKTLADRGIPPQLPFEAS